MQKIIKRLEIIKAAIAIEDESLIKDQVKQLRNIGGELLEPISSIVTAIDNSDFTSALTRINDFQIQYSAVEVWQDPEIAALKMELQALERKHAELSGKRDEYVHIMDSFNHQYTVRLGAIVSEILKLKMMIAEMEADQVKETEDELKDEFEKKKDKARKDYKRFSRKYESEIRKPEPEQLGEEDQRRLKNAYRKASRLCHPDMVADEFKKHAKEQFQELNEAYNSNNLKRVEEILEQLEKGSTIIASEKVDEKKKLVEHINNLQQRIDMIMSDIEKMKSSSSWKLVMELNGN